LTNVNVAIEDEVVMIFLLLPIGHRKIEAYEENKG
jgi:hypothetical protein